MRTLLILLALTTTAFAQNGADFLLEDFKNLEILYANLRAENAKLKKELEDAKQKSESGAVNGSGSTQPEVRKEGGSASGSR